MYRWFFIVFFSQSCYNSLTLTNEELSMKTVKDVLEQVYPNAMEAFNNHSEQDVSYSVVHYFGNEPKEKTGNFANFVLDLFDVASMRAPDTIQQFFKRPDIVLDYDKIEKDATLYILAKGRFSEQEYLVKATSTNKYIKTNYILEAV